MKNLLKLVTIQYILLGSFQGFCQENIRPLTVGDKIPDLSFDKLVNYSKPQLKFSNFNGKNIILDFWAAWCGPCLEQMPVLDSIQEKNRNELQIVGVTSDRDETVKKVYDDLKSRYKIELAPSIYNDTLLRKYFPNRLIPHYVWIGKDRRIKAITDNKQFTSKNISDFLEGRELKIPVKKDDMSEGYDYEVPLVKSGQLNAGTNAFYKNATLGFESILLPAFRGRGSEVSGRGTYSTGVNTPIIILYKYAYSIQMPKIGWKFWENNRFVAENFNANDSIQFGLKTHKTDPIWFKDELAQCYTYEIVFPDSTADEYKAKCMIQDLNRRFLSLRGFEVNNEIRPFKYLALREIMKTGKVFTDGGRPSIEVNNDFINVHNTPLSKFIEVLQPYCYTKGVNLSIVNKTGMRDYIDVTLATKDHSLKSINAELARYNLQLIEETEESRMMIVVTKKKAIGK